MRKFSLVVFFSVFLVGCGTHSIQKDGFGTFVRSLNNQSHGLEVIEDPTGSAPTKMVDRFEVRAGDCSRDSVQNDCTSGRERSEVSGPKERFLGKEYWYGWYIYVPNDWKDISPAQNYYGTLYQTNGGPQLMIEISNSGMRVFNALKYKYSSHYDIDKMRGKWTKVEIHAKWLMEVDGVMPDGFVHVYFNDSLHYSYIGNTASSYGIDEVYFKYGIYRARLQQHSGPPPTQIVYYAGVSRAKSRADLFKTER